MTDKLGLFDSNETRRSVMKKGAVATGALALGTSGFGTVAAQEAEVVVPISRFFPGADFDVLDRLQTTTTIDLLQPGDEPLSEFQRPDEWTGHVIRYDIGDEPGMTTLLFTRGQVLSQGDSGTISVEGSIRSADLHLIETRIDSDAAPDDGAEEEEEEEEEEETPTPEEEEEEADVEVEEEEADVEVEEEEETPTPTPEEGADGGNATQGDGGNNGGD